MESMPKKFEQQLSTQHKLDRAAQKKSTYPRFSCPRICRWRGIPFYWCIWVSSATRLDPCNNEGLVFGPSAHGEVHRLGPSSGTKRGKKMKFRRSSEIEVRNKYNEIFFADGDKRRRWKKFNTSPRIQGRVFGCIFFFEFFNFYFFLLVEIW